MRATAERGRERGQVLAIFVLASLAMIAMTALVVDGGNAWAQNRISQNGSDSAAEAGATVLGQAMAGATKTDADVRAAVDAAATAMELSVQSAVYTDIAGDPIGTAVGNLAAGSPPPIEAFGVAVTGRRTFGTFFARAIGIDQMTTDTTATAIAGGGIPFGTNLLPVTTPVNIVTCDGQNRPTFQLPLTPWLPATFYKIPLCRNGPGNVGWIDWDPTSGGTSELAAVIRGEEPLTSPIPFPSWQYVTQTGNTNSSQVEDALRMHDGEIVMFPLFDATCNTEPTGTTVEGCPPPNVGGQGQNQWYHFPEFAMFELCDEDIPGCPLPHGTYTQGNNQAECESGGNGATSCLVGRFVAFLTYGTVTGPPSPSASNPSTIIVVQLIK